VGGDFFIPKKKPTSKKVGSTGYVIATSAAPSPGKRAGDFVPSGSPDFTFSVALEPFFLPNSKPHRLVKRIRPDGGLPVAIVSAYPSAVPPGWW
jgi:hypothetical protein